MIDLGKVIPHTNITIMQVLTAVIILVIGWMAARIIIAVFRKEVRKTKLPELVMEFIARVLGALLYVVVILLAVSALGISVSSVTLGLSAVIGLILGFGLQDTMTNLFAGIWLAAFRPIDKDEVVTTNGMTGKVNAVGIMSTELLTPDNQFITIPNKLVWGSVTVNYSRMPTRRVDLAAGISYASDVDRAIQIALDLMKKHLLVLKDPAPAVVVSELADSSVNLQLRAWTKTEDYWTVNFDLTKEILETFRREGIEIPFPQMAVHLKRE
ncbi:MAG: mechanosensitive ion channel family protein [Methanophagales archaeon ANME-1-THS]|nr:MAG: mechanosensitive ion channel family protein [Methanophagales archaeon ANME-1-THS]